MQDTTSAIYEVSEYVSTILKMASDHIYTEISKDENVGITALSQEIAKKISQEQSFVYGVVGAYVDNNPELICVKGKNGGIMLKSKYDAIQQKQQDTKMEVTYSRFTVAVREVGFKTKEQFNAARRELGEHPTLAALKGWLAMKETKAKETVNVV